MNAAITSVNWIRNQNLNSAGLVLDSVNAKDCSRPNNWLFTYNQGKTIEGLAVLYDVTKDSQWSDWSVSNTCYDLCTWHSHISLGSPR